MPTLSTRFFAPFSKNLLGIVLSGMALGPAWAGTLTDISTSLNVSIPQAGQLITAAAILMGLGAPVFATLVAGWDRRRLLTLSLLWYGLLMGLSALAPSYGALLPLRVLAVISPAIFIPRRPPAWA